MRAAIALGHPGIRRFCADPTEETGDLYHQPEDDMSADTPLRERLDGTEDEIVINNVGYVRMDHYVKLRKRFQWVEAERDRYEEVYAEIEEALFGDEEGRGAEAIIHRVGKLRDAHPRLKRALRRCVDALEEAHDGKRYAAGRAALDLLADLESTGEDDA